MSNTQQNATLPSDIDASRSSTSNPTASSSSSSSSKINASLQDQKFTIVFNMICRIHGLYNIIVASEPLDVVGSESERLAFVDFKAALIGYKERQINYFFSLDIFIKTLSTLLSKSYLEVFNFDVVQAWDKTIQVMTVVMPPYHDIFLGHIPQVNDMPSGWLYVIPHYVQAMFSDQFKCLDDVLKSCLERARSDYESDAECNENMSNAIIIQRSPEILAISCESALLPENLRRQTMSSTTTQPSSIEFPLSLDLSIYQMSSGDSDDDDDDENRSPLAQRHYDLVAVVSADTASFTKYSSSIRLQDNGSSSGSYGERWSKSADDKDTISSQEAVQGSYYSSSSNSSTCPRFLLYVKRGLSDLLTRLQPFVSKAGQCRAMGDMTYALATTIDSYKEARRYYEEAIVYDASYRDLLKDTLQSLDKIDSIQHSRGLEEQGDISLVNHRLKESCEFYSQASTSLAGLSNLQTNHSNAAPSSSSGSSSSIIGLTSLAGLTASYDDRLKEKLSLVKQMQSLEIVVHCIEKGEEALRDCKYAVAKDYYAKATKLNPNQIFSGHFSIISSYVDKTMQTLVAIQKIDDAHVAMKEGKYRLANQLFSEAIILVPDKAIGLQSILDGFTPLIQCEDALIQQRAGLAAFEDKNYSLAVNLLTQAITLLPTERATDLAIFYSDRAMVYQELHEYEKALEDCLHAITLKSDYAHAHFRRGTALFSLGRYNDSKAAFEKSEACDTSLSSQVKVKLRQVTTAKEVAQRKEREAERARAKEEEKRLIEQAKKERLEKAAQEQQEKNERQKMKDEDKLSKAFRDDSITDSSSAAHGSEAGAMSPGSVASSAAAKEAEKQRQKEAEKLKAKEEKSRERERQRIEKERERDRLRQEKEAAAQKLQQEKQAQLALKLQQEQEASAAAAREQARKQEQERLEKAKREEELKQRQLAREKAEKEAAAAREAKLLAQQQQLELNRQKKLKEEEDAKKKALEEEEKKRLAAEAKAAALLAAEAAAVKAAEEAANAVAAAAMGFDSDPILDANLRYDSSNMMSILGSKPLSSDPLLGSLALPGFEVFKGDFLPSLSDMSSNSRLPFGLNMDPNAGSVLPGGDLQRSITSDSYFGGFINSIDNQSSRIPVVSPEKKTASPIGKLDSFLASLGTNSPSLLAPAHENIISSSSSDNRIFGSPAQSTATVPLSIFDGLGGSPSLPNPASQEPLLLGANMSDLNASAPQWNNFGASDVWGASNPNLMFNENSSLGTFPLTTGDLTSQYNPMSTGLQQFPSYGQTSGGLFQPSLLRSVSANAAIAYPSDVSSLTARTSSPGYTQQQLLMMESPGLLMEQQPFQVDYQQPMFPSSDSDMFGYIGSNSRIPPAASSRIVPGATLPVATIIPDHRFPQMTWLRKHNIYIHGWGAVDNTSIDGSSNGTTTNYQHYALNLTPEVLSYFTIAKVKELSQLSGCMMWLEYVPPSTAASRGVNGLATQTYLVFHHGIVGHADNQRMIWALKLVCDIIAKLFDTSPGLPITSTSVPNSAAKTAPPPYSYSEFPPLSGSASNSAPSSRPASTSVAVGQSPAASLAPTLEEKTNSGLFGKNSSVSWNSKPSGLADGFGGLFGKPAGPLGGESSFFVTGEWDNLISSVSSGVNNPFPNYESSESSMFSFASTTDLTNGARK